MTPALTLRDVLFAAIGGFISVSLLVFWSRWMWHREQRARMRSKGWKDGSP